MKKTLLVILLAILNNYLIAQEDVIYTIQALSNNEAVKLDSIIIENESNGKLMIFKALPQATAYKVNITKGLIEAAPSITTQLNHLQVSDKAFTVVQNFNGNLALNYNGISAERALVSVYNLAGMLEYSNSLTVMPSTSLKLELPGNTMHIISVKSGAGTQTFKAIGSSRIACVKAQLISGLQASSAQNSVTTLKRIAVNISEDDTLGVFNFALGDRLSVMVYKSNLISTPKTKILFQDESLSFELLTFADVYTDANIKTEIPIENGSTIDLTGYTLSYANKSTSVLNSGGSVGVKSFGKQKIVRHENGTLTSEAQGNIQLTKKGGLQYISLKNAAGNDIMFTTIDLSKVNDPSSLDISSINIESTALASLCLHPYFISSSPKVMETLKGQFKQLPSFNTYKNNLNAKLIEVFKTPQCISIDYSTIEGYANVIFDYLQAYKVEDYNWKGFVETVFNDWDGSTNVSYKIVNKGKRTIVVYANKQYLDGSVLAESDPIVQTEEIEGQSNEEPALFVLLEPGKLDYWSTVTGSFFGWMNKDMPDYIFKSETGDINIDLGNANRLELEVWGMGTLHKPISAFTTDEKYKLTFSVFLGILNDFITPGFELVSEVKSASEPIASGKFDFRYGSRRKPLFELAKKLGEAYLTDPTNWIKVSTAIETKDYASIIGDIPGFIAEEIFSDIDKPQNQTKYLNLIYNAYKNLIGESKQTDFVRGFIKNAYNSTFRNFSIANRTISLLEKIGDFTGSFYYVFADGVYTKSTFTKDFKRIKVAPTHLQLMPGEKKKISVCDGTGNISVAVTNPNTVTAIILSQTPTDQKVLKEIEVTGVGIGKTNLTITDLTNNSKVSTPILVQNQCYTDLDLSTKNLVMGISQNATVKIIGGSSKYSIKNTTTQSAVAVLKDNSVIIHARSAGVAQILVKDELSEQTKTITVNVVYFATLNPTKGLVAHYPFNGNANDISGNGNNGTVNGATLTTDRFGKANKAYSFNGISDYIEIPNSNTINFSKYMTISLWLKSSQLNKPMRIIDKTTVSSADGYMLDSGSGSNSNENDKIRFVGANGNFVTSNSVGEFKWYHLTLSFENGLIKFYINGVLDKSISATSNTLSSTNWPLFIGKSTNQSSCNCQLFNGIIDDVRIYNRTLTTTEVSELYSSEKQITDINSGLVAYYPFNGNAKDGSGNGNDGTVNGATLTSDRFGNEGKAYNFNGSSNYINTGLHTGITNTISLCAWVKTTSSPDHAGIVVSRSTLSNASGLFYSPDRNPYPFMDINPGYRVQNQSNIINDDKWHFIIGTYDGTLMKLYNDGILIATTSINTNLNIQGDFIIGLDNIPGFSRYFNGSIDDIRIYNRALSSDEVAELYNSEKPTLKSGLVAYYPFNGNANDESGNKNNGTVNGATPTTDRFGNAGKAYSFDGVNDYIRKANFTQVNRNNGDELTVSAWVKSSRLGGQYQDIVTNRSIAGHNWILYQHTNDGAICFHGSLQYPSNYIPQTNNWIHVVSIVTSTGIAKLYADGVLVFTNNNYTYGPTLPSDLFIGMHGEYGEPFSGSIDDVRIYNRALSSDEVTELYNSEKPVTPTTVTDIDGNVYNTIKIGTQTWMVENLNATHYRNGDPIANVTDNTTWQDLTAGAWCNYDNNPLNGTKYGKIYNWYAVGDSRNIAPTGWHVPTNDEWEVLKLYLTANGYNYDGSYDATGEINKIAKALAAKTDWEADTEIGTIGNDLSRNNSSGFSALPGGVRVHDGTFINIRRYGWWWTSTEGTGMGNTGAWSHALFWQSDQLNTNTYYNTTGFSVRCIKD
jgi:uncharacterized protein (TIGR02145 family)